MIRQDGCMMRCGVVEMESREGMKQDVIMTCDGDEDVYDV